MTLAFEEAGSGADVVLFVHGHPFDRSMWRPQLAIPGWRTLAPDLRGYGLSPAAPEKQTLHDHAADLIALLDGLSIARVVAVGLSMGGQIVMELVRSHPNRLRAVVLAATFADAETDQGKRSRRDIAARIEREGMSAVAKELLPKMLAPRAAPEVRAHVLRMMENAPPHGAAASLRGRAERPDYHEALTSFTKPALVVVGSEDAYTTRAQAEAMQTPHAELLWLEGSGHMPNLERTREFNAALAKLLSRS